jgi:hypothetical protein
MINLLFDPEEMLQIMEILFIICLFFNHFLYVG